VKAADERSSILRIVLETSGYRCIFFLLEGKKGAPVPFGCAKGQYYRPSVTLC
jgi:hypothetical protein